jgi:hypothetical protein
LKIAHNHGAIEKHLAIAAVSAKVAVVKTSTLMPRLSRNVLDPSRFGGWECQNVKRMTVLLVSVSNGVRNIAVLLNLPFNGVRANSHTCVAL